ncbi:S53 family peptidase [Burkholderia cepacia]|uniref:S53 family peptidase n=1 Tax=Burkholderia cepacia TaxID=292 RepID=UPI0009BA41F4|nr:S53 family serine peptidase [Burkholderia cepacia]
MNRIKHDESRRFESTTGRIPRTCSLALALLLTFGTAATGHAAQVLTRHVRAGADVGVAAPVIDVLADRRMVLDVVLPLRDQKGLDAFVADVTNPLSPDFRHYLAPAEFSARFGPTRTDYDTTVQYLVAHGLTVTGGSLDGMDVQVTGPASAVEAAFNLRLHYYRHPTEHRLFVGPDREPTTSMAVPLWHVSGLDNYSIPHPLFVKKGNDAKAQGVRPDTIVTRATTGSGPSASFLGSDMRAAYYGGTSLTGAGQHLGLLEYAGTELADLGTYFTNSGQTNRVPVTLLSTDGTSTSCDPSTCDDSEQTLDLTQALGMAPGLASLTMYVGSTDTAILSAMTTHQPLPMTIGCSWGWTPADPSTLDPYFKKMAAQGQSFFAASGDNSTWSTSNEAWPADSAFVISVGGTDLTTGSAGGAWKSETAWSNSGGGISPDQVAIPSWQKISGVINSVNRGSRTYRNGPDVSANADFTFYVCANQSGCTANEYGGTSFAAPMWAGFAALANQQAAALGQAPVGYFNPAIYTQNEINGALTPAYTANFHDIASGTSGSYPAVKGYDLVTGWGSPKADLIMSLIK